MTERHAVAAADLLSRVEAAFRDHSTEEPIAARVGGILVVALPGQDEVDVEELDRWAAATLIAGERPVAYAVTSTVPWAPDPELRREELVEFVRRGEVSLRVATVPGGAPRELGPRRVGHLDWVRLVRLPLGVHARGSVNAYVIDTRDGWVLLDTGFDSSREVLDRALRIAGLAPGSLRAVLCTHNHADHVGATRWLQETGWLAPDGEVVMHEMTDLVGRQVFVERSDDFVRQLVRHGIEGGALGEWEQDVAEMARLARWPEPDRRVDDRERVRVSDVVFRFVHTPGHSPDHCAIIAERNDGQSVTFLGDLTLGRGMPMVGVRDWIRDDPIADLLASWDLLLGTAPTFGLPGHGREVENLAELHVDILAAYDADVHRFLDRFGGRALTAADAMFDLTEPTDRFGVRQFAFYGSLAMLHHLASRGLARPVEDDPVTYLVAKNPGPGEAAS